MPAQRQAPVWGDLLDGNHASDRKSWSQQLRSWWIARHAARQETHLAALRTRWDATREAVTPVRANAALDMTSAHGARSVAILLYSLAL